MFWLGISVLFTLVFSIRGSSQDFRHFDAVFCQSNGGEIVVTPAEIRYDGYVFMCDSVSGTIVFLTDREKRANAHLIRGGEAIVLWVFHSNPVIQLRSMRSTMQPSLASRTSYRPEWESLRFNLVQLVLEVPRVERTQI